MQADGKHSSCARVRPIQGDVRCFQTVLVSNVPCACPFGSWMQNEHGETRGRGQRIFSRFLSGIVNRARLAEMEYN